MNRLLSLLVLMPSLLYGGEHWISSFPSVGVASTSAAVVVTAPGTARGVLKGVLLVAERSPLTGGNVVITGVLSATKAGQSRVLATVVVTSAVPQSATLALPVYDEALSFSFTAGGTNAHNQTHTVAPIILYER